MKLKLHFKCRRCGHIKVVKCECPFADKIDPSIPTFRDFLAWKEVEIHDCIDGTGIYGIADMIGIQAHDPSTDPA